MTARPTPEEIRRATFRVVFRGLDQNEVEGYLGRVAAVVEALEDERQRLASRLGEFAQRDLASEFESVGREVTAVLEAARQAAQTMRDRAVADAARWRSEAVAEAEAMGTRARSEAEALRSDAWSSGSQLLEQVQAEVARMRETAERDVLSIRGEAEREAHRMTSTARREAEEVVRTARMESERLVTDARVEHDDIIATAHRQAESAQERTRALEQRREELMTELESVRATLSGFEGELESRRQGLSEPRTTTRVVADESGETRVEEWEEGRTVRIIRPGTDDEHPPEPSVPTADELAAEVASLRDRAQFEDVTVRYPTREHSVLGEESIEPADVEPAAEASPSGQPPPDPQPSPGPTQEAQADPDPEPVAPEVEPEPEPEPEPDRGRDATETGGPGESRAEPQTEAATDDDVDDLFRRLRDPGAEGQPGPAESGAGPGEEKPPAAEEDEQPKPGVVASNGNGRHPDPFEVRERLLLPLTNTALRSVKRTLMDYQNEALDQIRVTDGGWSPDPSALGDDLTAELGRLVDEALGAGYRAAAELGLAAHEPSRHARAPDVTGLPDALVDSLTSALSHAGAGQRERSAAASRVFRGWRTDEAERRVRHLALAAYPAGLKDSLDQEGQDWSWESQGRLCSECRDVSARHDALPPVHRDCDCTIVPA